MYTTRSLARPSCRCPSARRGFGIGIALVIASVATRLAAQEPLQTAVFIPHWLPQAQFAGYYVAAERGFYRQRGLALSILVGGPDRPASVALERHEADFGTLWLSTAIQMRARGVPIVNIAQLMQRSALMLVAKASSGITSPQDMNGKKVAVWGGDFLLQPQAFFKKYDLQVDTVPLGSTINLFLRDGVQVTTAMWYNEYHFILDAGLNPDELRTFFFHEHGLNFPEDGLYCLEDTLQRHPQMARDFVAASFDGWQYAFAHPDEAVDVVLRTKSAVHLGANRAHQRWMLNRMRDLILAGGDGRPSGRLEQSDYDRVARVLADNGWITDPPAFTSIYQPVMTPP